MKQLAGVLFIRLGILYDYCFEEAICSMAACCDHVFVVLVQDWRDETEFELFKLYNKLGSDKLTVIIQPASKWDAQEGTGSAKLCYFTNLAIEAAEKAGYEYVFSCQADEILHEKSYGDLRKAIATGAEGFMITRINLWKSPFLQLDVPGNRLPCSNQVVRLAKSKYRAYGDAESLAVDGVDFSFLEQIRMYHMGFTRKRDKMKAKVFEMQVGVFEMASADPKLDLCEVFNPDLWFDPKTDLKLIDEPLPKIIQDWAKERVYED